VCLERRFGVDLRKPTSPDGQSGGALGLLRAALGGLDKWKTPSREDDFLQGHGTLERLERQEKTVLSRRLAPFFPFFGTLLPSPFFPPRRTVPVIIAQ